MDAGQPRRVLEPSPTSAATSATHPNAAPPAKLSPLATGGDFIKLPVSGFRDAIVSVPVGATSLRPVLIALHGNFDRPEWQCETWRDITDGYPFILCPRGIPRSDVPAKMDRWEYSSMDKTDRELEAGLTALRNEFAQYIAPGPILFTGFSLGAILGVGILKRHAGQYGPVVFSEGGNENWSLATVRKIAPVDSDAGTSAPLRLLYACGQTDCVIKSKATSKVIERAGGEARVVSGGNVGHMYDGPVAAAIKREWAWLIQRDLRWERHGP
jgi:predicted esterase